MQKGSFLIKEICSSSEHTAEFHGIICTPLPIKEVFEVRHELKDPRIMIGENAIAYFGQILIKIFYINEENLSLSLVEQQFGYRGFSFPEKGILNLKPGALITNKLLDIFVSLTSNKELNISGIISSELTLTVEKKINYRKLTESTAEAKSDEEIFNETNRLDDEITARVLPEEDKNTPVYIEGSQNEIYTELTSGCNQDITFILE